MSNEERMKKSEWALLLWVSLAVLLIGVLLLWLGLKEARGAPPIEVPPKSGMAIIAGIGGIILGLVGLLMIPVLAVRASLEEWRIDKLLAEESGGLYLIITDLPGRWKMTEPITTSTPIGTPVIAVPSNMGWFMTQEDLRALKELKASIEETGAILKEVTGYTSNKTEGQFSGVFRDRAEVYELSSVFPGKRGITELLVWANSNQVKRIRKLPHVEGIEKQEAQ
jgi:hypothetical protein